MTKSPPPRVAYFPDSYHEVNGVAHTSRHFEGFARRRNLPFLMVRAGDRTPRLLKEGNFWSLELPRSFLAFRLEKDLTFDPAFFRHIPLIEEVLAEFEPDLIHFTGPSDVGFVAAAASHLFRLPVAASWHTHIHEYAARRSGWLWGRFSQEKGAAVAAAIEKASMALMARYYAIARVTYAPTAEFCVKLERATGRPCHVMPRGVDAELFSPARRRRDPADDTVILGFVGRLSVEKNIALLVDIARDLVQNEKRTKFLIVGHGGDEQWLKANLPGAEFAGVLRGEALATAFANMDLFVFPSHTETFGNVVLEALASGVPAIVTPDGGPASFVHDGETGRIVPDSGFTPAIADLLADPEKHAAMRTAARAYALTASWDSVFEGVYRGYEAIVPKAAV